MKALVVYESMFGNTRIVAEAIARGLSTHMEVATYEVGRAPLTPAPDVDLLVVGAPTHAFGLSRATTRADAVTKSPDGTVVSPSIGLREWLDRLGAATGGGPATAAFDTKVSKPRLPGSAGRAAAKRLRHNGHVALAPAENFFVEGMHGPLLSGEAARAHEWGAALATRLVHARTATG